jgi:hypothetical protein
VITYRLDIVPGAGNESDSRANSPPGAYIVKIVGITRVGTMDLSKYDETQLDAKWRVQCWRHGNRVKTRRWLDRDGAKRDTSENKDKAYYNARKENGIYWFLLEIGCIEAAKRNRDRRKRGIK